MENLPGILINIVVPVAGVFGFLSLRKRMLVAGLDEPPVTAFFLIFAHYGALLVLVLTGLFWYMSGMASLGLFYLILLGPLVMIALAVISFKRRSHSRYHLAAFVLAVAYPVLIAVLALTIFLLLRTGRP